MRWFVWTPLLASLSGCFWIGDDAIYDRTHWGSEDTSDTDDTDPWESEVEMHGELILNFEAGPLNPSCADEATATMHFDDNGLPTIEGESFDCNIGNGPLELDGWTFFILGGSDGTLVGDIEATQNGETFNYDVTGLLDENQVFRGVVSGNDGSPALATMEPSGPFSMLCLGPNDDGDHDCTGFEPPAP